MEDSTIFETSPDFLIVSVVVCASILIFFLFFYFISKRMDREVDRVIEKSERKEKYLIINLRDDRVDSYYFKDWKEVITESYTDFLKKYIHESESQYFDEWMNDLLNDEHFSELKSNAVDVFVTNSYFKKLGSIHKKTLFKCYAIDKTDRKIFLSATSLYNIPATFIKEKNKFSKVLYEYGDIKKTYEDGLFLKGALYIIKIDKKDSLFATFNESEIRFKIIDALCKKKDMKEFRYYFRNKDEFELGIIDNRLTINSNLLLNAQEIFNITCQMFERSGYSNSYFFTLNCALISDLSHSCQEAQEEVLSLIKNKNDEISEIRVYKKMRNKDELNEKLIKNELIALNRNNGVFPYFSPIYHIFNNNITNYGYLLSFKVKSERLNTFEKVLNEARNRNSVRGIYSIGLRKALSTYVCGRESFFSKIILPIDIQDVHGVITSLSRINEIKESHLIFLIELTEMLDVKNISNTLKLFKLIHTKGYEIGALINQREFIINKEIFESIDCFLIEPKLPANVKADSREFIKAHTLLNRLIGFKKPLILKDSSSFGEIELLYKAGINYYVSSLITEPSEQIPILDRKIEKKIKNTIKSS